MVLAAYALAHACAADYVLGTANTNACPAGAAKITDLSTCPAAAVAVGKPNGGAFSQALNPSGCYLDTGIPSKVYLNTNATGAASPLARPLCVFGAPRVRVCAPRVCCVLRGVIQNRRGDGAALTRDGSVRVCSRLRDELCQN